MQVYIKWLILNPDDITNFSVATQTLQNGELLRPVEKFSFESAYIFFNKMFLCYAI